MSLATIARAPKDASIEEIEFGNVTAAGLGEVIEVCNGSAAEESVPPAVALPPAAPAEGEDVPDPLAA